MEKNEIVTGLASPLASEESTRLSLESIRNHKAGLNNHRQSLLSRVPDSATWYSFKVNTIDYKDLAYLSAATGDELIMGESFLHLMIGHFYYISDRRAAGLFQVTQER
ncbi:MAG: hypothetical protein IKP88_07915 [Lachnospiraceae bacterium]|nr:hypothetical protein [Lachnospiraceae bacterium]